MRIPRPGVRAQLTMWYASAMALILAALSLAIYSFVRANLERALEAQLDRDFAAVATVIAASPKGIGDGGHIPGDILFTVMDGRRMVYHSDAWCRAKFMHRIVRDPVGVWRSRAGLPYKTKTRTLWVNARPLKVTVAEDTTTADDTMRAMMHVFLWGVPCALLLSVLGGYFLAGRALSPVSAMAAKSREITAEALAKRLPVTNPNDELGRMATVFNETLARLEASFERMRNFTANVSHELRTPLTAIRSVGEVALQRPRDAGFLRDVVGSMLEEADRLTRLIDGMLAIARAESGRVELTRQDVDLTAEACAALDLVRVLAEEKRQIIDADLKEAAAVRGDPAMLRQALLNLLDNAIRYAPVGGRIRIVSRLDGDGRRVVEVEDNGPGIPVEHRERVFDRFYRAHTGADAPGTGLGLAIARNAVEAAGGRIEYEAIDSAGSRFRIVFPK